MVFLSNDSLAHRGHCQQDLFPYFFCCIDPSIGCEQNILISRSSSQRCQFIDELPTYGYFW